MFSNYSVLLIASKSSFANNRAFSVYWSVHNFLKRLTFRNITTQKKKPKKNCIHFIYADYGISMFIQPSHQSSAIQYTTYSTFRIQQHNREICSMLAMTLTIIIKITIIIFNTRHPEPSTNLSSSSTNYKSANYPIFPLFRSLCFIKVNWRFYSF